MPKLLPLGKRTSLEEALEMARKDGHTHEAAQVHALRVKPSIWNDFSSKAKTVGPTPHAVAPLALMDWAEHLGHPFEKTADPP